jgi:four helix bundle protein
MSEQSESLKRRLKEFALAVMDLADNLPSGRCTDYLSYQLIRAANGAGSNYRAACRGRSKAEFVAKLGLAAEESDESLHWLDMLSSRKASDSAGVRNLLTEADQLVAILSASYGTSRQRLANRGQRNS